MLGEVIAQVFPHCSSESSFHLPLWGQEKTAGTSPPLSRSSSKAKPYKRSAGRCWQPEEALDFVLWFCRCWQARLCTPDSRD